MTIPRPGRSVHRWGPAGVGLAALLLVAYFFGPVLRHPNDYLFLPAGDGIQSYYATAYYALYDHGLWFTGMNYPNGDHLLYPNLQPLLAWGLGWLQRLGGTAGHYAVAATNLAALASLVATPVVLYAILRRLRLPAVYAGLTALIIAFLSPQVLRLGPHMSLSYGCFVPILWYCIVRMQAAPRQARWYAAFGAACLLMGSVQVYFLTCGCGFLLAHALVLAWQQGVRGPLPWRMALAAVLPLAIFWAVLGLTDPVADRTPNPYGLLVYMATPASVFTPVLPPLRDAWQLLWPHDGGDMEGYAYIGLVGTGTLAVALLAALGRLQRWAGGQRLVRPVLPAPLRSGIWAAALLLLLAFALPFKWHAFKWLIDYAGPVKQFRSLGRFAWPFYYVAGAYTAYALYRFWRYVRRRRVPVLAWAGAVLLLVWGAEAWINVAHQARLVREGNVAAAFLDPATSVTRRLGWGPRQVRDFQAILPLPFFTMGSDKVVLRGSERSLYQAYKTSLVTGLPLFASYMPRASVGQSMAHAQLLSSPLIAKSLLARLPSAKPILLLVAPDALSPAEQRLVGLAHLLVAAPEASLYELPVAALAATSWAAERATAAAVLPRLPVRAGGLQATTAKGVIWEDFARRPDRRGRLGAGAFYEPAGRFSTLYDGPLPQPADTGRYEASVWVNGKMPYGFGNLQIKLYDAAGTEIDHQVADAAPSTEIAGDWVRVAVPFRRPPNAKRLVVLYDSRELLADDLLVRPLDTDVYYYAGPGHRLVKNTYPLGP